MSANQAVIDVPVTLVNRIEDLVRLREALASAERVACDTETVYREELTVDGIPGAVRVVSFGMRHASGEEEAFVVDLRDVPAVELTPIMAQLDVDGFNANFDEHALMLVGLRVRSWWDVMLADAVLRLGRAGVGWYRSLERVTREELGIVLSGKGDTQLSYDATSELTDEQVRYAGFDGVVTLRAGDWARERISEVRGPDGRDLTEAVELVLGARPFVNEMMMRGVPFEIDEYVSGVIAERQDDVDDALAKIAELTETATAQVPTTQGALFAPSGQVVNLFDGGEDGVAVHTVDTGPKSVPAWNPNSKAALITALNRWSEAEVRAFTGGRLLELTDPLRKNDLQAIGGPLAIQVLRLRDARKVVTTYGDDLRKYTRNGRFFSRYKQAIVDTRRWASFAFNAQNMSKPMKKFMRPGTGRVFVHADISQAELRFLAHFSDEKSMRTAFLNGEDLHTSTAADMFHVDMVALERENPTEFRRVRGKIKAVNFGIPYGMGPGVLAGNLAAQGIETTREEASELLAAYAKARPNVDRWLKARDDHINGLSRNLPALDWEATLRLYELHSQTKTLRNALRKALKHVPSSEELARAQVPVEQLRAELARRNEVAESDVLSTEMDAFYAERATELEWVWRYDAPVVLTVSGTPYEFYSYTVSGCRCALNVPVDAEGNDKFAGVLVEAVLKIAEKLNPARFAEIHGIELPSQADWRTDRLRSRARVLKEFEGTRKALRIELLRAAIAAKGMEFVVQSVLKPAMAEQVRKLRNKYRNSPIQGAVADVVERACAEVMARKPTTAWAVLSVHDSLVIECDEADATSVAELVRDAVLGAFEHYCPSVIGKVDVDVRGSLDDADVVWELPSDRTAVAA